jgi:hypothetical protein
MRQYISTDYSQNEMLYDGQSDYSTSGYGSLYTPIDYASGGSFGINTPVDYAPRDFGLGILPQDGFNNDGTQIDYGTSGYPPNSDVVVDYRGEVLVDYAPRGNGGLGLAPDGVDLYAPRNDEGLKLPDFKGTGTFFDDNPILSASTEIPSAQSDATFHDDASSSLSQGKTPTESPVTTTPAKPVSKNLKPYIYAGIAIVAILIAAKVLSKK